MHYLIAWLSLISNLIDCLFHKSSIGNNMIFSIVRLYRYLKKKNTLLDQNYTWKHDLLLCKNKIFIPKTSQLREHFTLYISSFISRGWCMLICPNNSSSQVWVEMFIAMSNAAWFVNRQRIQTPTLEAYYSHYQYRNAFWKISPCILSLVCHHLKVIRLSLLLLIACPWTFHSLETGLQ